MNNLTRRETEVRSQKKRRKESAIRRMKDESWNALFPSFS